MISKTLSQQTADSDCRDVGSAYHEISKQQNSNLLHLPDTQPSNQVNMLCYAMHHAMSYCML